MSEEEREYTEAELTGEEVSEPAKGAEGETGETATPSEPGPGTETPEKQETQPSKETPGQEEIPKTVPLAALREERAKRQDLQRRLEALEQQRQKPQKEFSEILSEDPEEAIRNLNEQIQNLQARIARREMEIQINSEIPDFLEKAPVMEELLLDLGFEEETVVNLIASTGKDAPKFFKLLSRIIDTPEESKLREQLTADLTPKITEEVTRQLLEKFKTTQPGLDIGNLPGATGERGLVINSEEEFAKLSPEMQEKWLQGQV